MNHFTDRDIDERFKAMTAYLAAKNKKAEEDAKNTLPAVDVSEMMLEFERKCKNGELTSHVCDNQNPDSFSFKCCCISIKR